MTSEQRKILSTPVKRSMVELVMKDGTSIIVPAPKLWVDGEYLVVEVRIPVADLAVIQNGDKKKSTT